MTPLEVAREFVRAFDERDLDAFEAIVAEDVELHSMKGLRTGRAAARAWATRAPGGVQQTIEVLSERERDGAVLLQVERRWHWDEDGSFAGSDRLAWLFTIRCGLVASWRPFEDPEEGERRFEEEAGPA